jgi:hypothetical protein
VILCVEATQLSSNAVLYLHGQISDIPTTQVVDNFSVPDQPGIFDPRALALGIANWEFNAAR